MNVSIHQRADVKNIGHKSCIEGIFNTSDPHRKRALSFYVKYFFVGIDQSIVAPSVEDRNK